MKRKQKYQVKLIFFKNKLKLRRNFQNLPLLIFQLTPFKFQLPSTKAPLPLITTLLSRGFKNEHLSPVFTVLQLGTGS